MMHEHDQELIMALAEGTLADEAADAARAEIAACAECSADLELQVAAIAMLDDLSEVYLTATESARLHSELKRELALETPSSTAVRRSFAWSRFLPVAGVAAALLVVIIAVPTLFSGGDSDDASDEIASAPSVDAGATETTAAASMDLEWEGAVEMAGGNDSLAESAPPIAAEETTEAPATTTTEAPTAADDTGTIWSALEFLGPVDVLDTEELLERIRTNDVDLGAYSDDAKFADPVFALCLEESITVEISAELGVPAESDPVILGIVTSAEGEDLILVAYVPEDVEETVFVVHRLPCLDLELLP